MIELAKGAVESGDISRAREILADFLQNRTIDDNTRLRALFYSAQLAETPLGKLDALTKALSIDSTHAKIRVKLDQVQQEIVQTSQEAIRGGRFAQASELLSSLLELNHLQKTAEACALYWLTWCSEDVERNIEILTKALALDPGSELALARLTELQSKKLQPHSEEKTEIETPASPDVTVDIEPATEKRREPPRIAPRSWQQPFRGERDIIDNFVSYVDQLLERAVGLPDTLESRVRRLQGAKRDYERTMQQKVPHTSDFMAPGVNSAQILAEGFLADNRRVDAFWTSNIFGEMCKVLVARNSEKYQEVYASLLLIACCSTADPEAPGFRVEEDVPELELFERRVRSQCLDRALATFFHPNSGAFRKEAHPNKDLGEHVVNEASARFFNARLNHLLINDRPRVKDFAYDNLPIVYKLRLPDEWSDKRLGWKKLLAQAGFEQTVKGLEDMGELINPDEVGQILPEQQDELKRAFANNDLKRVYTLLTQSAKEIKQALYREAQRKFASYREPVRPFLKNPRMRDMFHKVHNLLSSSDPAKQEQALNMAIDMGQFDLDNIGLREWVAYLYAVTNNRPAAERAFQDIKKRRTNSQQRFVTDWNLAVLAYEAKDERTAYDLLGPLLETDIPDDDLVTVVLAFSLKLEDRERFLELLPRTRTQRYAALGFVVAYDLDNREKQQEFLAQLLRGWQSSWEFPPTSGRMTDQELQATVGRALMEGQLDPLISWLRERINLNSNWVPNYLKLAWVLENEKQDIDGAFQALADRLRRPRMEKSQEFIDRSCRDMFELCKRRSRVDLGQKAYKLAGQSRPPAGKELLDRFHVYAATPKEEPAPPPPPPPAPTSAGRLPSDEKLLWVTARLSGVRTVQKYVQEIQAIEELIKILAQMSPQESPVVVEQIQQFSHAVENFSRTPSDQRDNRRFLYDTANGVAKRLDQLFAGALPQRMADMLTPYHEAVEQVLGDLSKQASIIPTLQATIDNPFISIEADRFALVMRITNESDRPVTNILANLLVDPPPLVSVVGSRECTISRLDARQSQFFNFQVQRNHLGVDARGITEIGFSITLKASAEGFEDIDLGIKKQSVRLIRNFAEVIGREQIPKLFRVGAALDSSTRELFQGRDDLVKKIRGSLEGGAQSERYFLDGIRRVGKTSILKLLPTLLAEKVIPVYFNFDFASLSKPGPIESWKTLQEFCLKLNSELPADTVHPAVDNESTFQADPGRRFRSYLDSVKAALPGMVPLFMFDEFPDLLQAVARSGSGADRETLILDQLRGLLDSGDLCAIFTGSMRFDNLSDVLQHRILGSLTPLRVSFLKKENVAQVLRAGMGEWIKIPQETVESVFDQSGGYPWFVQIYGTSLVDLMNIERRTIATPGDVATVTREVILPNSSFFDHWWPNAQLGSGEERFAERLFREYPDAELVPRDQFFEGITYREQPEYKRAFENLRACEVLDTDRSDVLRIRGAALRQWLKTRMFDGRLRIERSARAQREAIAQAGIFIDHENLIKALEEIAQVHGLRLPVGPEKLPWFAAIMQRLIDEATRRVAALTYRVAVAFWDRSAESRLQTAYHRHDFQLKQPEEVKKENAVDFKLVTEVHRAQQQAMKEGARLENVIIVSGDGDYAHLARTLRNEGVQIQMWAGSRSLSSGYRDIIGRENVVLLEDVSGL